jgi:FkbM family methyltransferase
MGPPVGSCPVKVALTARRGGPTGVRDTLVSTRDYVVDRLNRESPGRVARRIRADDRHLGLLLSFALTSRSNCIDVGANDGFFLRQFPRVAPLGRHIAYEPLPELCAELARRFPGIEVRQRALADYEGQSSFVRVLDTDLEAYSGLREQPYPKSVATETITVEVECLDNHLPDGWLPDFMKVDIEGAELLAFQGAIKTLRSAKPLIVFEHGPNASGQYGVGCDDIHSLLCGDVGLRIFDMDGNGPLDPLQFRDAIASGRWNWVAHE